MTAIVTIIAIRTSKRACGRVLFQPSLNYTHKHTMYHEGEWSMAVLLGTLIDCLLLVPEDDVESKTDQSKEDAYTGQEVVCDC